MPFTLPHDHLRWMFLALSNDGDSYPVKPPRLHAFTPHLAQRRDMKGRLTLAAKPQETHWPSQEPVWFQRVVAIPYPQSTTAVLDIPHLLTVLFSGTKDTHEVTAKVLHTGSSAARVVVGDPVRGHDRSRRGVARARERSLTP